MAQTPRGGFYEPPCKGHFEVMEPQVRGFVLVRTSLCPDLIGQTGDLLERWKLKAAM